jgi:SGNH domain (fused to AT3 domains)
VRTTAITTCWRHRDVIGIHAFRWSAGIIAVAAGVLSACSAANSPVAPRGAATSYERTFATTAQVLEAVKAAESIDALPNSVGFLTNSDQAKATGRFDCHQVNVPANIVDPRKSEFGQCAAGAEQGTKLMVIYGDSRAAMWGAALEGVAAKNGYKLRTFYMNSCPALDLRVWSYETRAPNEDCYQFHEHAVTEIRNLHPNLVVTTSFGTQLLADGTQPTSAQWQEGWTSTFRELAQLGTRLAMLGDIPVWEKDDARCLAGHVLAVQECSVPKANAMPQNLAAERAAASAAGALYISTMAWVCADRCEPVIADKRVYDTRFNFTKSYAVYLTGAVGDALQPALA